MSGLPWGIVQVLVTWRVAASITEMVPAIRLETYIDLVSRAGIDAVRTSTGVNEPDLGERVGVDDIDTREVLVGDVEHLAVG